MILSRFKNLLTNTKLTINKTTWNLLVSYGALKQNGPNYRVSIHCTHCFGTKLSGCKHSMRTLFVLQIVWLSKIQTKRVTVLQIVNSNAKIIKIIDKFWDSAQSGTVLSVYSVQAEPAIDLTILIKEKYIYLQWQKITV